ncbi:MAG: NDP-sugar synthase [Methanomassiliicoccales archaeon]|nr:MAG: NDP-sugar synthase [Methanomassiliicoccales archaeon]
MQAVILAGGLGTRMRPLTYTTPKSLLPIMNEPMVERLINTLPKEIDRVVIAASYMVDRLREHFKENDIGRKVVIVEEKEPLGTGGAIKNVQKHVDDTFIAINGDVISSLDYTSMRDFHKDSGGIGTISLWEVKDPTRYGIIGFDSQLKISRFLEKPAPKEVFSNWINAGVYILEPEIFNFIEPDKIISIEKEIFPPLASEGKLFGFKFYGFWVDAGTPEAYLSAHRTLLDKGVSLALSYPYENVRIVPPVLIGDECWIGENSEIGPYTCLGNSIEVLSETKITNSVVLGNTLIGRSNHLKEVIIGYGCTIEDEVTMGSGVVVGDNQILKKGTTVPDNSTMGEM